MNAAIVSKCLNRIVKTSIVTSLKNADRSLRILSTSLIASLMQAAHRLPRGSFMPGLQTTEPAQAKSQSGLGGPITLEAGDH